MARNVFALHEADLRKFAAARTPCVFISHRKTDKQLAAGVAAFLLKAGLDIYYDEYDSQLQAAHAAGRDEEVVRCIDRGLLVSTHLLGLISKTTAGSWWVPYEIGGARAQQKEAAHLIGADVQELPEYIKVGTVIVDQIGFQKWVQTTAAGKVELSEGLKKSAAVDLPPHLFPSARGPIMYRPG